MLFRSRQTGPYMVMGLCRLLVYTCASTASNLCSHCPHPMLCTASYPVPTLPPTCANLLRFLYSPFYFHISSLSSNLPPGILSSILGRVFCYAQHQGKSSSSRYCLRPFGMSFFIRSVPYSFATIGTIFCVVKSMSFAGSIAHLFEQT